MTPEWRDVSELRDSVIEGSAIDRFLDRLPRPIGGDPEVDQVLRLPDHVGKDPAAVRLLRQALAYERGGFPTASSHIQDRLDRVQAEVDRLRPTPREERDVRYREHVAGCSDPRHRHAGFSRDEAGASEGAEDYDLDSDGDDSIPGPPTPPVPDDVARRVVRDAARRWLAELITARRIISTERGYRQRAEAEVAELREAGDGLAEILTRVGHQLPLDSHLRELIVRHWDAWRATTGKAR